jgi:hypothetical protein
MVFRALKSVALVVVGWLVVASLPSLARYLRMREL